MNRKYMDCREMPSDSGRDLAMAGTHAATAHGHEDTPELREQLRGGLRDELPGALA